MKRSEMVEILATFLDHDYTEDADQILALLEHNGMLPPKTKLNTLNIEDNAWEPE